MYLGGNKNLSCEPVVDGNYQFILPALPCILAPSAWFLVRFTFQTNGSTLGSAKTVKY